MARRRFAAGGRVVVDEDRMRVKTVSTWPPRSKAVRIDDVSRIREVVSRDTPFDELEPPEIDPFTLNGPQVTELMTQAGLL